MQVKQPGLLGDVRSGSEHRLAGPTPRSCSTWAVNICCLFAPQLKTVPSHPFLQLGYVLVPQ